MSVTGKDRSPFALAVCFSLSVWLLATVSGRHQDRSTFSQWDAPYLLPLNLVLSGGLS